MALLNLRRLPELPLHDYAKELGLKTWTPEVGLGLSFFLASPVSIVGKATVFTLIAAPAFI